MNDAEERRQAAAAQAAKHVTEALSTPALLNALKATAKWRRAKYEAYVEAGFLPGQALWLCAQDQPHQQ